MVENVLFLAKNDYLEHKERGKFCKMLDVFDKNVDKKENSRRIFKAVFRSKTLIKRDLIKMAFDCILENDCIKLFFVKGLTLYLSELGNQLR